MARPKSLKNKFEAKPICQIPEFCSTFLPNLSRKYFSAVLTSQSSIDLQKLIRSGVPRLAANSLVERFYTVLCIVLNRRL
jgi:hypothetical protein